MQLQRVALRLYTFPFGNKARQLFHGKCELLAQGYEWDLKKRMPLLLWFLLFLIMWFVPQNRRVMHFQLWVENKHTSGCNHTDVLDTLLPSPVHQSYRKHKRAQKENRTCFLNDLLQNLIDHGYKVLTELQLHIVFPFTLIDIVLFLSHPIKLFHCFIFPNQIRIYSAWGTKSQMLRHLHISKCTKTKPSSGLNWLGLIWEADPTRFCVFC